MKSVVKIMIILILLGLIAFAGLVGFVCYKEAHPPVPANYDAIIVLGAQVLPEGEASVQLGYRLDKALEIYQKEPAVIVACGARGGTEPMPEGDFMRNWFIENGVPEDMVLAESKSFNTRENVDNAMVLLKDRDIDKVAIVTSDYHLARAMAIAEDAGVSATGIGSPCKNELGFWAKNHFREALAWVKYWLQKYL